MHFYPVVAKFRNDREAHRLLIVDFSNKVFEKVEFFKFPALHSLTGFR